LQCRLIADQFPLVRQVQIACDVAKFAAARLSGKEAPKHADTEATFEELQARIQNVMTYLKGFSDSDFTGAAERKVLQPRVEGKYIEGRHFLIQVALPNFYFHLTTAYAILRANGVELGKSDYLGQDLPYKRL
jgi:hypothetical protein